MGLLFTTDHGSGSSLDQIRLPGESKRMDPGLRALVLSQARAGKSSVPTTLPGGPERISIIAPSLSVQPQMGQAVRSAS